MRPKIEVCFLWSPILVILALLGGCVSNFAEKPATEVRAAVKITYNRADGRINFLGPPLRTTVYNTQLSEYEYFTAHLRGWKDFSRAVADHQFYVDAHYSDAYLRLYRSAYFEGGPSASFTAIDNRLHGCRLYHIMPILCDFEEVFAIALATELLERHRSTGLSVWINAQSGKKINIRLPSNYIQGYLDAVTDGTGRRNGEKD